MRLSFLGSEGNHIQESEVIDDMNTQETPMSVAHLVATRPIDCTRIELKQGTYTLVLWEE